MPRRLASILGAHIAVLVVVPSAHALDVTLRQAAPVDTDAAVHSDFHVRMDFPDGAPQGLRLSLPPGLVGDPGGPATCSQEDFAEHVPLPPACPAESQVGVTTVYVSGLPSSGTIYNLEPGGDMPALLGIAVMGVVKTTSPVRVRLDDYGLDSTLRFPAGIDITRVDMTLQADVGGGKTFMVNPTSCVPATVRVQASAGQAFAQDSTTFTPTDCRLVPFSPSLEVGPRTAHADTPGEAEATLVVPGTDTVGPDGKARRQAHVGRVELQLPDGLVLSPGLANGLEPCTEEQFGVKEDRTPSCSPDSEIGIVRFSTPVFAEPLEGKVYLGVPKPGQKLRNFVSVEDPRLRVKLIGDVVADPVTGRVTNIFPSSPQVPFTRFLFRYHGGPRAVLTSPVTCATHEVNVKMSPWSGQPLQNPRDTFATVDCPPPAFGPTVAASVSDATAGGDTALNLRFERADRQGRLQGMKVSLPAGLAGHLGSVPGCAIADARAAACPEGSRIGSVRVAVGTGPSPLTLPGQVHLTEAYDHGIAGMAIVVPAKAGGLDFGTAVTLAAIRIRDGDAGIDVETDPLPQIIDGIRIAYRTIDLTVDRPGFMRNATSCSALAVRTVFTGTQGESHAAEAPYRATGCDGRPYAPRLTMRLGGKGLTGANANPSVRAILTQDASELTSRKVAVTLPTGIGTDLSALRRACPEATVLEGSCPAAAKVGEVVAETPLLPFPLRGDVLFTAPATPGLPKLSIALPQVGIRLVADVAITKDGRLQTVFGNVPDVPLTRFELALTGGKGTPLISGRDLCNGPTPIVDAAFEAHGGKQGSSRRAAIVDGCAKPTLSVKQRLEGRTLKLTSTSSVPLEELRLSMTRRVRPGGEPSALRRAVEVRADGRTVRQPKLRISNGRIVVAGWPKAGARKVEVTVRLKHKVKKGRRLSIQVDATPLRGKKLQKSLRARAR